MVIGIDMGHSLSGSGTGAVGIYKEVDKNREVGNKLIAMLKEKGHTVVNCTVDYANSEEDQLVAIVKKANAQKLDLFVSLHLNSFNGEAHGVETFIYSGSYPTKETNRAIAKRTNDKLASAIGWYNRGVKEATYYVLRGTVANAMLVELGFCDSKKDMNLWNADKIAKALFEGITNTQYVATTTAPSTAPSGEDWVNTEIKRYKETGKCYPNTTINFRNKPSTKTGTIQGQYYNGESLNYDLVVITNGYTWVSWVSASSGLRRYMPITDRRNGEKWAKCV